MTLNEFSKIKLTLLTALDRKEDYRTFEQIDSMVQYSDVKHYSYNYFVNYLYKYLTN